MQRTMHDRFARLRPLGDFEQLVQQVFGNSPEANGAFLPPADIRETDSGYQVSLELPGVQPADVAVEFNDGHLQISGEKKNECCAEAKANVLRTERRKGPFSRTFQFTTDVDADNISAAFDNGVLCITLPKAPQVLPKKIQIKSGTSA